MRRAVLAGFIAAFTTLLTVGNVSAQMFPTYVNGQFTLGNAAGNPYQLSDTFLLESNPNATKMIYLDFDGYLSQNNAWSHSNGAGTQFDAFDRNGDVNSFSNSELREIQKQFQNVAEDFLGFDVNVTTRNFGNDNVDRLRRDDANDQFYGIRSLNTQSIPGGFGAGTGGIAYLNSFNWTNDDSPVFAFNKGENNGGMTNSHEIGHALGLRHDGLNGSSYHPGTGSGETGWGPIMGAPFGKNVTQWSNGDYAGSTTTEDDLSIITKNANGFGFRADDIGSTIGTASAAAIALDGTIFEWGIIEENTDVDFFEFDLAAGELTLDIAPFQGRPNLDILAQLYDSNGILLSVSDDPSLLSSSFLFQVQTAGLYYLAIEGTGSPNASDYGSLGFFTVAGSFAPSAIPEPTSLGLLGCLAGFAFFRRRRPTS